MRLRRGAVVVGVSGISCFLLFFCISSVLRGGGVEKGEWHTVQDTIRWERLHPVDLTSPTLYSLDCLTHPLPDESCPVFYRCPSDPSLLFCQNPRLADLATGSFSFGYTDAHGHPATALYQLLPLHLNVFMVEEVYMGGRGQVFTASSSYRHGGCVRDRDFTVLLKNTGLPAYSRVLNLVWDSQAGHSLVMALQLLFQVRRLVQQVPDLVILLSAESSIDHAASILGITLRPSQLLYVADVDVVYARQGFVPVKPPCLIPPASVWREFREYAYFQSALLSASASRDLSQPPFLVLVLEEGLGGAEQLAAHLEIKFNVRAVLVVGSESFQAQAELFSTAEAVIGAKSSLLDMVVFMRARSNVVEVLPPEGGDWFAAHLCRALSLIHKGLQGNFTDAADTASTNDQKTLYVSPEMISSQLAYLPPRKSAEEEDMAGNF